MTHFRFLVRTTHVAPLAGFENRDDAQEYRDWKAKTYSMPLVVEDQSGEIGEEYHLVQAARAMREALNTLMRR